MVHCTYYCWNIYYLTRTWRRTSADGAAASLLKSQGGTLLQKISMVHFLINAFFLVLSICGGRSRVDGISINSLCKLVKYAEFNLA